MDVCNFEMVFVRMFQIDKSGKLKYHCHKQRLEPESIISNWGLRTIG